MISTVSLIDQRLAAARRVVVGGFVLVVPIAYLPGLTLEAFNIPKVALLAAGVSIALALKVAEISRGGAWSTARSLAVPASWILLPLGVSWLFASHRGWALLGEHARLEGLIPYLLLVLAAVMVVDSYRQRSSSLCKLIVSSGTLVSLLALLQGFGLDASGDPLLGFVSGPMGNSNFLGAFLAIVLPLAVGAWVLRMWNPMLGILTTALIATGILMSFSQGAWFASSVGAVVVAASRWRSRPRIAGVGAIAAPLIAITIALGSVVYASFVPYGEFIDQGASLRSLWLRSSVAMAADSPLVGHGPSGFAMEAVRYREPIEALIYPDIVSSGPHSVPASFLAAAGIPGLLGFIAACAWGVRRSAQLWRSPSSNSAVVFAGALASYLVVAVVNDHLMMEFAFWMVLAGLAIGTDGSVSARSGGVASWWRRVAGYSAAAAIAASGLFWSGNVLVADIQAQAGVEAFQAQDVDSGRRHLRAAIGLRDEYLYRETYGNYLGRSALQAQDEGGSLIAEMDAVLSPLESWPKLSTRLVHGAWLHEWSVYDPQLEEKALAIFERAHDADAYNPWLVFYISDIHLQADRPEKVATALIEAISIVESYPDYEPHYSDLWANLSIAYLEMGDLEGAENALARVRELAGELSPTSSCRTALAFELRRRADEQGPTPEDTIQLLRFRCTQTQLRLVPDLLPST